MNLDTIITEYNKHSDYVHIIMNMFGISRQLADDMVSETFLKLLNRKYNNKNIRSLIITISKNNVLDYLNKYNKVSLDIEQVIGESSYFDDKIFSTFINDDIQNAVDNLPRSQSGLYKHYFIEGLSYKELAKEYGTGVPSIGRMIYRLRKKLQKQLKEYG